MPYYNLGLIGYPISASVSPQIHGAALKETGLDGEYKLYPIAPDDIQGLKDLLDKVRSGELQGLNVTIPHKQNVIPLVDELSPTATTIGAVNTIVFKDSKLIGDNTDAPGFWNDLQNLLTHPIPQPSHSTPVRVLPRQAEKGIAPLSHAWERERPEQSEGQGERRHALVLGAGGAARAVTYALLSNGWDITLAVQKSDIAQAETLINDFTSRNPQYATRLTNTELAAPTLSSHLSKLSLIVNATPVGMKSHHAGTPYPAGLPFPKDAVLYDVIYTPAETQLMQDAAAAGLPTRNGLGMLVGQALLCFEIWTGKHVSADKIDLT